MFRMQIARIAPLLAAVLLAAAALPAWSQSAAGATQPYASKAQQVEALRLAPGAAPATRLQLGPVDAGAIQAAKLANTRSTMKRLQIGIGRAVKGDPLASSDALRWVPVAGGFAAHWEVASPSARALRIGLAAMRLPDGAQIRFVGSGAPDRVYGPFTSGDLPKRVATWWSPVLEGDTATVEIFVEGAAVPDVAVDVAQVSHLFASPADPKVESVAKIGESGSCEVDIACRAASDVALAQSGKAVARMVFSDAPGSGSQFLCTGTLLNAASGPLTAYFYGANHCISTQDSADTLTTFWFYDATSCNSGTVNPGYVQLTGGATLLFANQSSDGLLLRLKSSPPGGAYYSGWDAALLAPGTALTAIHHPAGDVKKVSLGTMGGFGTTTLAGGSFLIANWNSIATGVTERGSSGSGIFTAIGSPASEYRLRGGLLGGPSSCTAAAADLHDYYSRLDQVYPYISAYLDPASTSCTYSLSPASQSLAAAAASGSLTVTTQPGCAWATTSTVSWITATSAGNGSGSASYTVDANPDATTRTGGILVGNQSIAITQAGDVVTGTNIVANPGFESGTDSWTWSATSGSAIIRSDATVAHSGSGYAWFGGYTSGTDTIYQDVTIPANASLAQLRFWYWIETQETSSAPVDTMTVAFLVPASGNRLATLASLSNVDSTGGTWVRSPAIDVTGFKGQTLRLAFSATNNAVGMTSFFVDDISLSVTTPGSTNYTSLWWNPTESGWGLNVNQQGDIAFATLFTYDSSGNPMWLVMSRGDRQSGTDTFSGPLYRTTGPAFNANPFTPINQSNITQVGTMTIAFSGPNSGTLTYTMNGVTVAKSIQQQVYGSRAASCQSTTADRGSLANYQDLWWAAPAGSESGWGINITHQDQTLFGTLFTYDAGGRGVWLVMSAGTLQSDGSYLGDLYIVTGMSAFNAQPFVPLAQANIRKVGTMQLRFSSGTSGTLTYSFDGVTVVKSITRQVFWSPLPACS